MTVTLDRPVLRGDVSAIPSKSEVHRLLIAAALADRETHILCMGTNDDMERTASSLSALGAGVFRDGDVFTVTPISEPFADASPDVGESGSTLRFLVPVAAALGGKTSFYMHGRLPLRPMSPLREELERHGAHLSQSGENPLTVEGHLSAGEYRIRADVSSQFVSGLLFALPLLDGCSTLVLEGKIESEPYIRMTEDTLRRFAVDVVREGNTFRFGGRKGDAAYRSPSALSARGDWSNAAFFLAAGAIGRYPVTVTQLSHDTHQGDRAVVDVLSAFGAKVTLSDSAVTVSPSKLHGIEIDAAQIPDLVPILSVVAAVAEGETVVKNASRLRLKESDRIESVAAMLRALGGKVAVTEDGLRITGSSLTGGIVSAAGDHRIAMSAAIAATVAGGEVQIDGAEAVNKSYPKFFDDLKKLCVEEGDTR